MAGFVFYDLVFLVLFCLALVVFLYKRKKNVKRQGIIFLYKTDWGIKLMDSFSRKNKSWLKPLQYVIIASGVVLMAGITWLIIESTYLYLRFPITSVTKAPPIAPLIPYFPKLFGLSSFFPPLYFTYFIIAVALGGILHEVAHGIFARLNKLKVKSTGFLFLGPFLGAFVEPDEKKMAKAKKTTQLGILAAGTFANVVISIVFGLILIAFFATTFSPAGLGFNSYASTIVDTSSVHAPENFSLDESLIEIESGGKTYLVNPKTLQKTLEQNFEKMIVFENAPAIKEKLPLVPSAITEFDGEKVTNIEELSKNIQAHNPGEDVKIKMAVRDGFFDTEPEFEEFTLTLGEKEGRAFLGIGIAPLDTGGKLSMRPIFSYVFSGAGTLNPLKYYESSLGSFGWFIYFLLWWVFLINVLLALFNMLPFGPLDGGKFMELAVAGVTKSDKAGRKVIKIFNAFILTLLILMMIKWAASFF